MERHGLTLAIHHDLPFASILIEARASVTSLEVQTLSSITRAYISSQSPILSFGE